MISFHICSGEENFNLGYAENSWVKNGNEKNNGLT